jgi:hypothetical protein
MTDAPPDLQELVERAGRRYTASIGEEYVADPFKRPAHQGGYQHITPDEWADYDAAIAGWQVQRRKYLAPAPARPHRRRRIKRNTTSTEAGAS